jgi:glyoxylase-like metal-dependent hydrolase (beta-lactamase superfamily II)
MFWEEESGILFSGDTVYDGPLVDDAYHSDIDAYVASMKRIYDLPVRIVHGGHFPSFSGARYRDLIRGYLDAKGA